MASRKNFIQSAIKSEEETGETALPKMASGPKKKLKKKSPTKVAPKTESSASPAFGSPAWRAKYAK